MAKKTETEKKPNPHQSPTSAVEGAPKPEKNKDLALWLYGHKFWAGVALLVLIIAAVAAYLYFARQREDKTDTTVEEPSLGETLESIEFDESLSEEERASHYLSVAAAFLAEGNSDKALANYLLAEQAGQINSRLYSDVAGIYEDKADIGKRDEYLNKMIVLLNGETVDLTDQLSVAGNYIVIAQTYEKLGNQTEARVNFEKALAAIGKISSKDVDTKAAAEETRQYLEEKLAGS